MRVDSIIQESIHYQQLNYMLRFNAEHSNEGSLPSGMVAIEASINTTLLGRLLGI